MPGKGLGVRADDGVLVVRDVEGDPAVIGVDRHLDRVADVVADAAHGLGIRIAVGRGVGVEHPHQAPVVGHDEVGVAVVPEKRGGLSHARGDVPVDHHAALRREVVGQEHLDLPEAHGEGELGQERVDGNPALAFVPRVHVLIARRVVELLRARAHEHVVVPRLPVVDRRSRDPGQSCARGRDVLQKELREPLGADPVDRARHEPVAVRVGQMLVDEAPARQEAVGELAGRQHDLAVLAVDGVAIHVHVEELVVGADLLKLAVRHEQRPIVPQPDVLDREAIALERGGGQVVGGRELLLDHAVERVRLARHPDIVLDEGALGDELIGRDPKALEQRRIHAEAADPEQRQRDEPGDEEAPARPEDLEDAGAGAEQGEDGEPSEDGQRRVHVGVGRAEDETPRRVEQIEAVEPEPHGPQHEQQCPQSQQVGARARRQPRAVGGEDEAPLQHVHGGRQDQGAGDEGGGPSVDQAPDGQLEDEEPEVAAEERVRSAERHRIHVRQDRVPRSAPAGAREQCDHRDDGQEQPSNQRLEDGAAGQTELILELPQHVRRCGSRGHGEIEEQEREHDAPEPEEEPAVQGKAGREDLREADFLEPEPIRVQGHGLPQSAHGHEQDEEPQAEARTPARTDRPWGCYVPCIARRISRPRVTPAGPAGPAGRGG